MARIAIRKDGTLVQKAGWFMLIEVSIICRIYTRIKSIVQYGVF